MRCSTSPGKLGMLKWGHVSANSPFWQMIGYGAASELCPRTATTSLGALFSSLRGTRPYVPSTFSGSDVLTVVRFERCHHIVRRSCSALGFQGDCHLKLLLICTLESENLKSILTPIYIWTTKLFDNKAFDTEILSCYSLYEKALQVKAE